MARQKTIHEKLTELAWNLWWSWQPDVGQIFREIDPPLWAEVSHNPLKFLRVYSPEKLELAAREKVLHSRIHGAYRRWREYMHSTDTWGDTHATVLGHRPVAYFSAEFGMHESIRIYSGGLGVLSGDHLKSASDLGIPLVAVTLFYREGYFSQTINQQGWQEEIYTRVDPRDIPIQPVTNDQDEQIEISVETRTSLIKARVWKMEVGRIMLYLLDTDVEGNTDEDRALTARLYGGDQRMRIRQEMMLGIGGVRALDALGIIPRVIHMNEGHSAFAPLEVIRQRMHHDGLSFDNALRETRASTVFTTHTPVPAGHDRFDYDLMNEHLGVIAEQIGLDLPGLMGLGRVNPQNGEEPFCMTVLAFKTSRRANAVSNLHGVVSRRMWRELWPWRSDEEIPIGHITNGVHVPTWLSQAMRVLYDKYLHEDWLSRSGEPEVWAGFERVAPGELWEVHQALKNRLILFTRERLRKQAERHKLPPDVIDSIQSWLDPEALLVGFARRFAPYKRANLVMHDLDRLAEMVSHAERPIQFIFAGKAHPRDDLGKRILQGIVELAQDERFRGKIVFLEDYDIDIGRRLVQGVDLWLNNPRRPLEASGTSGQKVVLNGGLNCSILDGWWNEAYDGKNGFAIGTGRIHSDQKVQDARDAADLIKVLEEEVIPLYYRRDADALPQEWIERMKRAVRTLGWRFNADRMVMDYVTDSYIPAAGGPSCEMSDMP